MSSELVAAAAAAVTAAGVAATVPRSAIPSAGSVAAATRLPAASRTVPLAALGASALVLGAVAAGLPFLVVAAGTLAGGTTARLSARGRGERRAVRRRERVVDACEAMLGELQAGQSPSRAVERAAVVWPGLEPASRAARLGGDVPAALRNLAEVPGAAALHRLAGAWQVCGSTGSGLATAVDQVLAGVRAEHEVALLVRSELASARATARLLAVLPVLVLLMAQGIGARPWDFLFGTLPGQVILLLGTGLAVAGVLWLERIADEAQR